MWHIDYYYVDTQIYCMYCKTHKYLRPLIFANFANGLIRKYKGE